MGIQASELVLHLLFFIFPGHSAELPFSPSLTLTQQGSTLLFNFYDSVAIINYDQTLSFFYALVRKDPLFQQQKSN